MEGTDIDKHSILFYLIKVVKSFVVQAPGLSEAINQFENRNAMWKSFWAEKIEIKVENDQTYRIFTRQEMISELAFLQQP